MGSLYDHPAMLLLLILHTFGSVSTVLNIVATAQNTNFSFANFTTPENFLMVDDVQPYAANYSLLMNSRAASLESSSCRRLFYNGTIRMKDSKSGTVASFHTAVTFQITGPENFGDDNGFLHADRLAFTFARNSTVEGTAGMALCLLRQEDNGMAANRLFAVEFDTFRDPELNDLSDNHIGMDVNSVASTTSYNLCGGRVQNCSYLCTGGYFTAWIDYDSGIQNLQVFFAKGSLSTDVVKPSKPILTQSLSLVEILDEYMYVGFSASTQEFSEVHWLQSWSFQSTGMPELGGVQLPPATATTNLTTSVGIIAGVSAAGGVAALLLTLCMIFAKRDYGKRASSSKQDKFNLQNFVPRMFTYRELSKVTKSFNRSELLGTGGIGAVYKGTLPSGALVAVKWMRHGSKHSEESFQAEAASLSQIRHRNLVQLRGWCSEEDHILLVYDDMCNGSLDEHLFKVEPLSLALRHSVLTGVAAALSYLHEDCAQCVLHRDIKSSNVLLDGEFHAYLGDFGLAPLVDHQKMEKASMMAGTLGYMAPEIPHTGKAIKETDVFSFGVLMLEVVSGARPLDMAAIERGHGVLVDKVWRAHEAGDILQVVGLTVLDHTSWCLDGALEEKEVVTRLLQLVQTTFRAPLWLRRKSLQVASVQWDLYLFSVVVFFSIFAS